MFAALGGIALASALGPAGCSLINKPDDAEPPGASGGGGGIACKLPSDCGSDTDCTTPTCDGGTCGAANEPLGTSCDDNGGEVCNGDGQCVPAGCIDMKKNGKESDVDCGGGECPGCDNGKSCGKASDCTSGFCNAGSCAPCDGNDDCAALAPTAFCDGGVCKGPKVDGESCASPTECASGVCSEGTCCKVHCDGSCGDCKTSGMEGTCVVTAMGATGAPACTGMSVCDGKHAACTAACFEDAVCPAGKFCADLNCCDQKCDDPCDTCLDGKCSPSKKGSRGNPWCFPYACNGGQTTCATQCTSDIECADGHFCSSPSGGFCDEKRTNGTGCTSGNQCRSSKCIGNVCASSCTDGIKNGTETSNDCGGDCPACFGGKTCKVGSDCQTGFCSDGVCCSTACNGPCDVCTVALGATSDGFCTALPVGSKCEDAWQCSQGETCQDAQGTCGGGSFGDVHVFFEEDFSDNAAGWKLDPEWEIGPAKPSGAVNFCLPFGDPAIDHTPSKDNGVAGAVIGGGVTTMMAHPLYYLTSPAVDTSKANTLTLELYRWLQSDYPPFMENSIEVTADGMQWTTLWKGPPDKANKCIITDRWEHVVLDITAHRSDKTQVRFGFAVLQAGVYEAPSWTIDDVLIADHACNNEPVPADHKPM
jgi:hypothetical protein